MKAIRFYFVNIILAVIIIGILSVVGIYMFCNIHKVKVTGNTVYTDEEIESYVLDGKYPHNAVYQVIQNRIHPKKDIPFVESVRVKLAAYDKIKITVQEKTCVGYIPIESGGYCYFDEEGTVNEISERVIENSIAVTGISLKEATPGQKVDLKKKQLNLMVQLLKSLKKYDMQISSLAFDELGNATVTYADMQISFGNTDFLEEKMMRLSVILPKLEGEKGTLHLENWSKDNTDIVFQKAK